MREEDSVYENMNARRDDFMGRSQELADELDIEVQKQVEDNLHRIRNLRDTRSNLTKQLEPMEKLVRDWLETHWPYTVEDPERGLQAVLAYAGETVGYDTPNAIRARDESLYRRLSELDCFSVDHNRVIDCIKKGLLPKADIEAFSHRIERTRRLMVEETK